MTSRHPSAALSKIQIDSYNTAITFLKNFIEIMSHVFIGDNKAWKPSQTGAILSTNSILQLQEYLFETKNCLFLLTSRFSQDCVENLFSCVRVKQPLPTALQFKNNLRLLSVCQYLKNVSNINYDEDDRENFSDFLETIKQPKSQPSETYVIPDDINIQEIHLSKAEMNSFYCVCGYIVHSLQKNCTTCSKCIDCLGSKNYKLAMAEIDKFTQFKCFKKNTLFFL